MPEMQESILEPQKTKRCSRCKSIKLLTEYQTDRRELAGVRPECRACSKSSKRDKWDALSISEKEKSRSRWRVRHRQADYRQRERALRVSDPHEWARHQLRYAVTRGKIAKPSHCQDCQMLKEKRDLHGHHDDYSRPLEVRWVCYQCHGKTHRAMNDRISAQAALNPKEESRG